MNEPKKRGRPAKVPAVMQPTEGAAPQMNGDAFRIPANQLVDLTIDQVVDDMQAGMRVMLTTEKIILEAAQAYAMRVWSGQSESLGRGERIRRCEAALQGQNLPTEDVKYPGAQVDDDDWTEEDSAPVTWRKASQ